MRLAISSVATVLAAVSLLASSSTEATKVDDAGLAGRAAATRRHHSLAASHAAAARRAPAANAEAVDAEAAVVEARDEEHVPDGYWNNPDILYKTQRLFEASANIRVLGPLPPRIAGAKPASTNGPAGAFRLAASADAKVEVSSSIKPRKATAPKGLINGLGIGQDPSIIRIMKKGKPTYYYADSDFQDRIMIRKSKNLSKVNRAHVHDTFRFDWRIGTQAPDIARYGKHRWIYTISSTKDDQIRSLVSESNDPLGKWRRQGIVTFNGAPVKGFDSHVFTHPNGKRYLMWSDHASLLMAELLTSRTVGKPSAILSMMGDPPSKLNFWNCEAPATVIAPNVNGSSTINIAFSTGDFRTPDYTTRILLTDESNDPLVPRSWILQKQPLLKTSAKRSVFGPGSVAFFPCGEGRKCVAYGAWAHVNTVTEGGKRRTIRIQHAEFDKAGELVPLTPIVPTNMDP